MAVSNIYVPWEGWHVVRPLGHGSFGKVYQIERTIGGTTEKAAMKVISIDPEMYDDAYGSQYSPDSVRKVFEESLSSISREYQMMYELRGNPNIVRCDDMKVVRNSDGESFDAYIMMELLTPLHKKWKTAQMSVKDVMRLGEDICRALTACEKHNIIHRDIKPQNILISDNGTYKLGDFGTARAFEHTASATKAGTETYMAPEITRREKYGRDVDTYSLGLVMYRMLNRGRLPFIETEEIPTANERERALQRRLSGEALPEPAEGSPALKAIVLKACSFDRRDRYSSAEDMLEDLAMTDEATFAMFPGEESTVPTVLEKPVPKPQVPSTLPKNTEPGSQKPAPQTKKPAARSTKPAAKPEKSAGRHTAIWILLVAAALVIVYFAGNKNLSAPSYTAETYSYAGISFDLPSDWEKVENKPNYQDLIWEEWSAPTSDTEGFVGISVEKVNSSSNSWDYEKYCEKGLQGLVNDKVSSMADEPDYEVVDEGQIEIGGTECRYCEYKMTLELEDYDTTEYQKYELYIPVLGGDELTLVDYTYTTSDSDRENRNLGKKIIGSIRIE